MAVKNPQFEINLRKNTNTNNPGYGKYYPKAKEKKTISQEGLINHMVNHNSIYGEDLTRGVLIKLSGCLVELLSQGNPVKIDGLGTFVPKVESTKEGITKEAILEGRWNAAHYISGIHIRFIPEGAGDTDITYGVEEKVDITPEEQDPTKKEYVKKVTPLDDWIREQSQS